MDKKKPQYKMADAEIVSAEALWPDSDQCKGKFVARGVFVFEDGERGNEGRTSLIVAGSIKEGFVETLNSVYTFV
ncbi:hypothetical protein [Pseudomonas sp. PSPC2-3]|uniref:hypothetical protein n=1 Tax=Pseudomonas sp. PSPC2-3 TaxID=2804561 RepID=UPI003CEC3AEE